MEGGARADKLDGGTGNDFASYANATFGVIASLNDSIQNNNDAAGDTYDHIEGLIGSAYADQLTGDKGDNTLEGGAGADTLQGDDGNDFASYAHADLGVTVSLADPTNNNTNDAAGDTYDRIEGLIGSTKDDHLIGNEGDNTLEGGAGNDTLEGGGGNDFASYAQAASGVTASLANKENNIGADAVGDTYDKIEGLIGSAYADLLIGDDQANILLGSAGDDTLEGGEGNDTIQGGTGNDFASYANTTGPVIASLANPDNNTSEAQGDSYTSIEGLIGSAFDDQLTGDKNDNTLQGGEGADRLDGDDGFDFASYADADAENGVTANLGAPEFNNSDATGDIYVSIEGLIGSDQDDLLTGDNQNNSLQGGDGNDDLKGLAGNDTLEGGVGDDTIDAGKDDDTVIWHKGDGSDTITLGDGKNTLYLEGWSDEAGGPVTAAPPLQRVEYGTG